MVWLGSQRTGSASSDWVPDPFSVRSSRCSAQFMGWALDTGPFGVQTRALSQRVRERDFSNAALASKGRPPFSNVQMQHRPGLMSWPSTCGPGRKFWISCMTLTLSVAIVLVMSSEFYTAREDARCLWNFPERESFLFFARADTIKQSAIVEHRNRN